MAESRWERGKQKMTEIAQVPPFDPPDAFTAATIDRIFGELWQRPASATGTAVCSRWGSSARVDSTSKHASTSAER